MSIFEFAPLTDEQRRVRDFESFGSIVPFGGVMPTPPPGYDEWIAEKNAAWEAKRPEREAEAARRAAEKAVERAEHKALVASLVGLTITGAEWVIDRSDEWSDYGYHELTLSDGRTVRFDAQGYDDVNATLDLVDEDGA